MDVQQASGIVGHRAGVGSKAARMVMPLGWALPLALALVYILGWWSAANDMGLETVVRRADFVSTLTGANIIVEGNGGRLYTLDTQRSAQQRVLAPFIKLDPGRLLPYNHLPFEALVVAPFVALGLPYPAIFGLWSLLMLLALILALRVMQSALPVKGSILPLLVVPLVTYQPVLRSFILGQNSPLVLLGLCLTFALTRKRLDLWAGPALLLVALKPQILPVVGLMLLLQGRWRALASFAGSLAALCLTAMLVLGVQWPLQYAQLLIGVAGWQDTGAIDPAIMHNWRGFATNLLGGTAPGLVMPLFGLLSLLSVGLLVAAWLKGRKLGATPGEDGPLPLRSCPAFDLPQALAGIVAVLTSLHLNPHDLTLLLFPAWIVAFYALSEAWSNARTWLLMLWGGYALIHVTFYLEIIFDNPAVSVVPSTLLMSAAAWLIYVRVRRKRSDMSRGRVNDPLHAGYS